MCLFLDMKTKEELFDIWWHDNNDDSLCYECARRAWLAGYAGGMTAALWNNIK